MASAFQSIAHIGTQFADTLTGDANDQWFTGGGGADLLNGGAGFDTADYSASTAAVRINLATNVHMGGDAAGDSLTGTEAVIGSALADTLVQPLPGPFYERAVKLITRLQYLATHLQNSDYGPTDQARESQEFLRAQLRLVRTQFDGLVRAEGASRTYPGDRFGGATRIGV